MVSKQEIGMLVRELVGKLGGLTSKIHIPVCQFAYDDYLCGQVSQFHIYSMSRLSNPNINTSTE